MDIARIIESRDPDAILVCDSRLPVRDAIALLAGKRIGALPVVEDSQVVGIFSERDVIYRMAREGAMCLDKPVGQVMTAPAITVERSLSADQALSLMTTRRIRHLPVVENGELVGFVSIGDLVKSRIEEVQREADTMRTYIQSA